MYLKIKFFITIPFVLFLAYMVYQGNPHIYHSQQVPSTYEAFGRLPRSNSYMELYPSSPYAGYPSSGYGGVRGAILGKIQNSLNIFFSSNSIWSFYKWYMYIQGYAYLFLPFLKSLTRIKHYVTSHFHNTTF